MRFLSVLAFFTLFVGLSSCLPDAAGEVLTTEIPEVIDEPVIATNFLVNGNGLEIDHGYLFKVSADEAGTVQHHLVLTADDVEDNGGYTGNSEAITITITAAADADLSGEYVFGDDVTDIGTASAARYYQNLRFDRTSNYEQGYFNQGSIILSRVEEEYIISFSMTTTFGSATIEGTFQGNVSGVDLMENELLDERLFQGANNLKYGDTEVGLNHAYLYEYGNADSGSRRYRLYLSEDDIAPDALSLTGRSDLIFFYVNEEVIEKGGKFSFGSNSSDYLSNFVGRVNSSYYCKNMDFRQNRADEDVPMDRGEINVEVVDGEIVIAFTGLANTGKTASGLYRGPMVRMD